MIELHPIKRTDPRLLANMENHYSHPKGFVGRNICYAVMFGTQWFGSIVGGSSTLHLPGRDDFFGFSKETKNESLKQIINNIFFHVEKRNGEYPVRNFTVKVLKLWRERVLYDWEQKYDDKVIGFESLVELPRSGELYRRDGWTEVGTTIGYSCKRTSGKGTDSWSGKRIWDTENLKPKLVFCRLSKSTIYH
jgi:hypothetical protein